MKFAPFSVRFLCICLGMLFAASALAQSSRPSSRIVHAIDETSRIRVTGTTPKSIKAAQDLGAVEGTRSLNRMILVLAPSSAQQASLNRLVVNQHSQNSPDYHKWLTPEQFAANFGPSDDDLTKVKQWLQSRGLNPTGVSRGRQWIEFSGNAQQVNSAFATSMHQFQLNGKTHIANSSDISIPEALAPVVAGVLSLNNFRKHPLHSKAITVKRNGAGKLVPANPDLTTVDGNGNYNYMLAPADIQAIYNLSPLLKSGVDGKGISIAIPGRSNIFLTDVQSFRQVFGLPQNDPNIILNGVDPQNPYSDPLGPSFDDMGESTLDVELAGAAAPGATINFVTSASSDTTDGIDLSSAYIVDNALSPIVSLSYGSCEELMGPPGNEFYYGLWQQGAAEGMTIFVSTGDGGAAECDSDLQRNYLEPQGPALYGPSVNGIASTPFNVAVGGTQFNEANNYPTYWSPNNNGVSESALGYIPEQAWNQSCDPTLPQTGTNCAYGQTSYSLAGGGGGPSNCSLVSVDSQQNLTCLGGYPKPSWQTGIGVPDDAARDTPDLSLNASPYDDTYLFCFFGSCQTTTLNGQTVLTNASTVGGTSAAAPTMAGIMALVEQKNGAFQGQANYVFYKLAAMDKRSSCDSSTMTNPTLPSSCIFNDITMGSNSDPGLPGYGTSTTEWAAGTGYDMATGLGTVNAANMVANWDKVSFAGSATTLTASGSTLTHGQPFTIKVSVKSTGGSSSIPTGDVVLATDKYGDGAHVTLDASGNYSGPVNSLPGGTYNLTARYGGDGTFAGSVSSPISLTGAPEASAISVDLSASDPNSGKLGPYAVPLPYTSPLFIDVTVAGKSGQGLPTGTVNVLNGKSVVLSAPLTSSGTAHISTGQWAPYTFPVGTSTVSVQYLGDNSFNSSTSSSQQVTFQKLQPSTNVNIGTYGQAYAGQPISMTGQIPPQGNNTVPTGTLQFYDNGQPLGNPIAIVDDGVGYAHVSYTATLTTVGMHSITVGYSGDANFKAVSGTDPNLAWSNSFMIVPSSGAATVTTLVQTPTTVVYGQSFSYIVTVTPAKKGGPVPTGQVLIVGNNASVFGSVILVNGQGNMTTQSDAMTAQVVAEYQGDSNYAPSTSPAITTKIARMTPPVSLTSTASYVLPGQQTSLNMVVVGYNFGQTGYYRPTGTVQFFTAVNGGPPQAITPPTDLLFGVVQPPWNAGASVRVTLPTGTNVVTATYSGEPNFNPATTAPVTIVVSNPDFTVSSTPSTLPISAGGSTTDALTVTPILGFAGTVSLSCAGGLPAGTTCNFSPSALPGSGGQSGLTITMQGPFSAQASNKRPEWMTVTEMCGLVGLCFLGFSGRRRKTLAMILTVVAVFGFLSGCGSHAVPSSTAVAAESNSLSGCGSHAVPSSTAVAAESGSLPGCGGHDAPWSTVVVLESSQSKVASGTAVTFTAQVSGGDTSPRGSVTFYDGKTALGNDVDLRHGQASLTVSKLLVGTHPITVRYSGDSSHTGSVSQAFYEAVTGVTTLQVVATSGGLSHTLDINLAVQ